MHGVKRDSDDDCREDGQGEPDAGRNRAQAVTLQQAGDIGPVAGECKRAESRDVAIIKTYLNAIHAMSKIF